MAEPLIRTTYALDAATVIRLDRLARRWGLSRSAALRKLVREAEAPSAQDRQAAWQRLRGSLSHATAEAWRRALRAERAAADPGTRKTSHTGARARK